MIKQIKMVNIKKHAALGVVFTEGVNVIVGPNYAGKSSILHGILFGLFGVRAIPGNADDFWTDDTPNSFVDLDFEIAGVGVRVHRTRTTATLDEDGALTASGATAVNGRIADLMGVPMADFLRIKYSRQKETAGLLSFGATNLNGLIERVGGISVVKKAIEALTSVSGTSKGVLSVKEMSSLPPLRAAVKDAKAELSKGLVEAAGVASQGQGLSEALVERTAEVKEAEEALTELISYQGKEEKLLTRIKELKESTREAETSLGELGSATEDQANSLDEEVKRLLEKTADLASAARQRRQLEESESVVKGRLLGDAAALADCLKDIEEARPEAEGLPDVSETAKAVARADAANTRATSNLMAAQKERNSGACEACGRPFEDGWSREEASKKVAEAVTAELDAAIQLKKARMIANEAEEVRKHWNGLNQEAEALKLRDESRRSELASISAQLRGLPDTDQAVIDSCDQETELHQQEGRRLRRVLTQREGLLSDLSGYASAVTKAHGGLQEVRRQPPKDTTVTSLRIDLLKSARDKANEDLHSHDLMEAELKHTCTGLQRELDDAEHYLSQAEEDNQVVEEHTKRLSDATELKKFLSSNREAFMKHSWDRLLAQASTLCSHATGGALSSMQREGDVFSYTEDGRVRALTSASGGQESLMGLSLKVALSESIPDSLSCLLLDEVTADLDEPHSAAVTSLLGNVGCQIITVSHRDMDRSGLFNVISLGA